MGYSPVITLSKKKNTSFIVFTQKSICVEILETFILTSLYKSYIVNTLKILYYLCCA